MLKWFFLVGILRGCRRKVDIALQGFYILITKRPTPKLRVFRPKRAKMGCFQFRNESLACKLRSKMLKIFKKNCNYTNQNNKVFSFIFWQCGKSQCELQGTSEIQNAKNLMRKSCRSDRESSQGTTRGHQKWRNWNSGKAWRQGIILIELLSQFRNLENPRK